MYSEWVTNQHRDTYASHVGHYDQLSYYAVAQNESITRVKLQFLEVCVEGNKNFHVKRKN